MEEGNLGLFPLRVSMFFYPPPPNFKVLVQEPLKALLENFLLSVHHQGKIEIRGVRMETRLKIFCVAPPLSSGKLWRQLLEKFRRDQLGNFGANFSTNFGANYSRNFGANHSALETR